MQTKKTSYALLFLLTTNMLFSEVTEIAITLSPKVADDVAKIFEKSGDAINQNVYEMTKHFGAGLKDNISPGIAALGDGGADALKTLGTGGADAMKNLTPGITALGDGGSEALQSLGKGGAAGLRLVQNEFLAGFAKTATVGIAALAAALIAKKYIQHYLFEPSLIEKRSSSWLTQMLYSPFKTEMKLEDHMVISDQLSKDLNYIMKMTKNIKKNGGHFENVLLYGEPGTGKTLFAQLLAEHCGMSYAFVPAANVSKFLTKNSSSAAAHELDELFAWAASNRNGTVLFFDEAETFLAQRSTLSIEAQTALAAFLAKTGTPSNKIMIICATNRPEIMDSAVLSRLGFRVEFPLPDLKAREAQLAMHVKKTFAKQTGKHISYKLLQGTESLRRVAQQMEGCSGRSIQKAVNRFRQTALAEDVSSVTQEIIDRVIKQLHKDKLFAVAA